MKLSELIKQDQFTSAGQHAMLNVVVTSSWLMSEMTTAMAPFGITPAQYNVLRILRGSHPGTLTCSDIGDRLLDRTPDVTRLLNRLERTHLIHRARAAHDRRIVEVRITDEGLALIGKMDTPVAEIVNRVTEHLAAEEHQHLSHLLERMRAAQQD